MKYYLFFLFLVPMNIYGQNNTVQENGNISLSNPNPKNLLFVDSSHHVAHNIITTKSCKIGLDNLNKIVVSTVNGEEVINISESSKLVFSELHQLLDDNKKEIERLKKQVQDYGLFKQK